MNIKELLKSCNEKERKDVMSALSALQQCDEWAKMLNERKNLSLCCPSVAMHSLKNLFGHDRVVEYLLPGLMLFVQDYRDQFLKVIEDISERRG